MSDTSMFAVLRRPRRIWAVAAVHAEAKRLCKIHRALAERFETGDRLVYLGNLLGRGPDLHGAINELLNFRRAVISGPGMFAGDVAVLRGAQEEMWQKLLQLQFAANPAEVLAWMLDHGVASTIEAYGSTANASLQAVREGTLALARWTASMRAAMNEVPGHTPLLAALKRAAYSEWEPGSDEARLLFVHTGIDVSRPLATQVDSFWWATGNFSAIAEPYAGYACIVRGYDHSHSGLIKGQYTLSIDGGCGSGGSLLAACLSPSGEVLELLDA